MPLGGSCDSGFVFDLGINVAGNRMVACVGTACSDGSPCAWMLTKPDGARPLDGIGGRLSLLKTDGSVEFQVAVGDDEFPLVQASLVDEANAEGPGFQGLSLSPDGKTLLVAQRDGLMQEWRWTSVPRISAPVVISFFSVVRSAADQVLELSKAVVYEVTGEDRSAQSTQLKTYTSVIGVLWLSNTQLLLVENVCTDHKSSPLISGAEVITRSQTRLAVVESASLLKATDVSHCQHIAACVYTPVETRHVVTLQSALSMPAGHHPVSATWGPVMSDGRRMLITTGRSPAASPVTNSWISEHHVPVAVDQSAVAMALTFDPYLPLTIGRWVFGPFTAITWIVYFVRFPVTCGDKLDPATSTYWQRNKLLVVTLAHFRSILVSGAVFGYPALEIVLRSMGVYAEGCVPGDTNCASQIEGLGAIALAGFLTNTAGRPIWGWALDFIGPKYTSTLGMVISCIGIAALLPASADQPFWFATSWALLGFGGASIHLANYHIQYLFPKNVKPVSVGFTVTFALSAIIFSFVAIAYDAGFSWASIIGTYLTITLAVTVLGWFLQPVNNFGPNGRTQDDPPLPDVKTAGDAADKAKELSSKSQAEDLDIEHNSEIGAARRTSALEEKPADCAPRSDDDGEWGDLAKAALTSGKYWLETSWFWIGMFEYQWYIGTLAAQLLLIPIEDSATPAEVSVIQFTYLQEANLYNAFCGLAWPISAYLIARWDSLTPTIAAQLLVTIIYTVAQSFPSLAWMPTAFFFQAVSRFLICAAHHAFLATEFPIKIFGIMNASSYIIGTTATLLVFPLQLMTVYYLNGNWYVVNYAVAIINAYALLVICFKAIVAFVAPPKIATNTRKIPA